MVRPLMLGSPMTRRGAPPSPATREMVTSIWMSGPGPGAVLYDSRQSPNTTRVMGSAAALVTRARAVTDSAFGAGPPVESVSRGVSPGWAAKSNRSGPHGVVAASPGQQTAGDAPQVGVASTLMG